MKKYSRVFHYLSHYKPAIAWYFVSILLSIVFSIVSIGMLLPFMQLIFDVQQISIPKSSGNFLMKWINENLNGFLYTGNKQHDLGIVCILIIVFIALKTNLLVMGSSGNEKLIVCSNASGTFPKCIRYFYLTVSDK